MAISDIPIIDIDTHIVEPPDLWTSRVPAKWRDQVPLVRWDADAQEEVWYIGDRRLHPVGNPAMAGWHQDPPLHPPRFSDIDPTMWDPVRRAKLMDDYHIQAAVLYPNLAVFHAKGIFASSAQEVRLACVQAYNDYLLDFAGQAPGRFVPIAVLPFWDIDLSVAEIKRAIDKGHRGVAFTQDPTYFGLPKLTDRHWDRLWAAAQDTGYSVNFHVASGSTDDYGLGVPENGVHANFALVSVGFFLENAKTISQLTGGGICHRFPRLNFVSVESGIGWLPFALESMDWQWKNCGAHREHPEYELLPSEYFRRQIYGSFWFERDAAHHAIAQLGPDNILYETDYPHPTCMSPGPCSAATRPDEYLRSHFSGLDEGSARKILHDNAARLYGLG